jgi:hypothetical protein
MKVFVSNVSNKTIEFLKGLRLSLHCARESGQQDWSSCFLLTLLTVPTAGWDHHDPSAQQPALYLLPEPRNPVRTRTERASWKPGVEAWG